MSKKSRTFQPGTTGQSALPPSTSPTPEGAASPAGPATTDPGTIPPTAPVTTPVAATSSASRAALRRKAASQGSRAGQPQSFFERYRTLILGGAVVAVVALVLLMFGMSANTKAYECVTFLTPPPAAAPASPVMVSPAATGTAGPGSSVTPDASLAVSDASPAPGTSAAPGASPEASAGPEPTPQLGFVTQDLGKNHVGTNVTVKYGYCPPASGSHYNLGGGQAPLTRQFYGPQTILAPGNWVHNLEHGYVVILYRGDADQAVIDAVQAVMAEATPSETSAARCGYSKVIGVRFDDMDPSVQVAAIAWDRVLLQEELDKDELLAFANQWQDGPQTPEPGLC